jgi:flagellar motor component MotA
MRARFGIWAGIAAFITGGITIVAPLAGVMQPALPGAEVAFAVSTGFLGIAFGYFFATEHQ